MALIECPACRHTVSDEAEACPGCGCPVARRARIGDSEALELTMWCNLHLNKKENA